jgi:hypothetical protein
LELAAHVVIGPGSESSPNAEIEDLARHVAEAQIELARVRRVRHRLLAQSFNDLPRADTPMMAAVARTFSPADFPLKCLAPCERMAPQELTSNLSDLIKQLLAIDRYERRALWHRRCAIRAFTSVHC